MTTSDALMSGPATVPGTMMRALAEPLVGVRLEESPVPTPAAGQVLVRTALVGICGSDTHAVAGHHPFLDAAYVPGHEATGSVVASGEGSNVYPVGQRVLLKPNVACGDCENCRASRSNACERLSWIGCDPSRHWSGAMAQYFVAPEANLYAVPDSMSDETATLVECLATPVHAARIAGDLTGARVAILGAGTIGVLCVVAALQAGARSIAVTDMEQSKIDRAIRLGARGGVLADTADLKEQLETMLDGPVDVVFDCVANETSLKQGVELLRRAGTLLIVGVPPRAGVVNLPIIQDWEIRVQGCAAYTEADVETAIRIATAGGLPTAEIASETFPLAEASLAFERAAADTSGKVFVGPL
ncbi:MAG TPA: alcohol dehydrogenase catalytic domain-containing protein [Propionicimonas sp.]|jgi:threonine dehydrogenase-like Zn-dependent dehydrogenase